MTEKKRIDWIDFAKGLTILFVIVGHSAGTSKFSIIIHDAIYSFHMPLFFILSAVTCKLSISDNDFKSRTIKTAKHLLLPFMITHIILIFWVEDINILRSADYWKSAFYTFIFSAGAQTQYYDIPTNYIISWFFAALFISRTVFDYLHLKIENENLFFICICLCSLIGVALGRVQWLPFSADIALASLPLLYFGYYLKDKNVTDQPFKKMFKYGILWLITFLCIQPDFHGSSALLMATRWYPLFPICFLSGMFGTMAIVEFSVICCNVFKNLCKPMLYIGKNTLYLLCIHSVDSKFAQYFVTDSRVISTIKRLLIDLLILLLVMGIRSIFTKLKSLRDS